MNINSIAYHELYHLIFTDPITNSVTNSITNSIGGTRQVSLSGRVGCVTMNITNSMI